MIERHDYYAYLLISSLLEAARAAIGKARNSERLRREEPGRRSYFALGLCPVLTARWTKPSLPILIGN